MISSFMVQLVNLELVLLDDTPRKDAGMQRPSLLGQMSLELKLVKPGLHGGNHSAGGRSLTVTARKTTIAWGYQKN